MIALIWGALTSRVAGPVATAAAIALAAALAWQTFQLSMTRGALEKAQDRADAVERDLRTCKANTQALEASLAGQNAAVDAWKAEGDARSKRIEEARQEARAEASRADRAAAALAKLKPTGADLCARMLAVDEAVKEIR